MPHATITNFSKRPSIGQQFIGPNNQLFTIASSWAGGVVFKGGPACSADELLKFYKPAPVGLLANPLTKT